FFLFGVVYGYETKFEPNGPIQLGGPCYDPDTVVGHASYVLELVYRKQNSC
ncbi:hypothetical protein MIMGU_mgv11b0163002mg, partial [Erythranthe guttata]